MGKDKCSLFLSLFSQPVIYSHNNCRPCAESTARFIPGPARAPGPAAPETLLCASSLFYSFSRDRDKIPAVFRSSQKNNSNKSRTLPLCVSAHSCLQPRPSSLSHFLLLKVCHSHAVWFSVCVSRGVPTTERDHSGDQNNLRDGSEAQNLHSCFEAAVVNVWKFKGKGNYLSINAV